MTYTVTPTINIIQTVPAVTQAAYQFYADGTESGGTALDAQDTPITANIASDVNVQLRVRLQSTNSAPIPITDDWRLQYEINASGAWNNVVPSTITDKYLAVAKWLDLDLTNAAWAQSFMGDGKPLLKAGFYLRRNGTTPTGTLVARLYAPTGDFGSTMMPTGSPIATTNAPMPASYVTTPGWYWYTFSGVVTLTAGLPYCITIEGVTSQIPNGIGIAIDGPTPAPTHPGNAAEDFGGWGPLANYDVAFQVGEGTMVLPYDSPNLSPQYTTNRLTGGTGSFEPGAVTESGSVVDWGWSGNNHTELLFSITLKKEDLKATDTLRFRVAHNAGTTGMTYTATPTINVTTVAGPPPGYGTGTTSWVAATSAAGVKPVVSVKQGSATVSWAEAPAAVGKEVAKSSATTTYTQTLTAVGKRAPRATATTAYTENPVSVGRRAPQAAATTAYAEALTAVGQRVPTGATTTIHSWVSTAVGAMPAVGAKTGSATVYYTRNPAAVGAALTITQAAYRFYDDGTEAGSTALAAQDTTPSVFVSGTANLQLRMRMQTNLALSTNDDFRLQYERNASGTWENVLPLTADAYSEENQTSSTLSLVLNLAVGQSFTGNGQQLLRASFPMLRSSGLPVESVTAELYEHTGTFGTSSLPTGAPLAVSTSKPSSAFGILSRWEHFDFDGSYTLVNGTKYIIAIAISQASDTVKYIAVAHDTTVPTHPGNRVLKSNAGTWTASATADLIFRVYTTGLTTTACVIAHESTNVIDNAATTNRLTAGSGNFVAGRSSLDGMLENFGWTANNHTEVLYTISLLQANLANSDTLRFRVLRNGIASLVYAQTPTIAVTAPAGPAQGTAAVSHSWTPSAVGKAGITFAIRRVFYSGTSYYYYIDWKPALFEPGGDRDFTACFSVEPGGAAGSTIYLNSTDWEAFTGVDPIYGIDGPMTQLEYADAVDGYVIAGLPSDTVYNLRFDHTGYDGGSRLSLRAPAPPNVFLTSTTWYPYLYLTNGVSDWLDQLPHDVGPLSYSSTVTPAKYSSTAATVWAHPPSMDKQNAISMRGPAPGLLTIRSGALAALESAGLTITATYSSVSVRWDVAPLSVDRFTGYASATTSYVDSSFMSWDPLTPKTAQLLISDHYTVGNFPTTVRTLDTGGTAVAVYKTGGTVLWTGPEIFALKDQTVTLQKVGGVYILSPLPTTGTGTGSHSWGTSAAGVAGIVFSPADITGLAIWVDASQLALADGAYVEPWPSIVGSLNGSNFNVVPYQPVMRYNGLNGKPVVRFTAGGGLRWTNTGIDLNWTVVYVGRMWNTGIAGRIVTSQYPPSNLLIGHWNYFEDVFYVENFLSPDARKAQTTDWNLYTATGEGEPGNASAWAYNDGVFLSGNHPVTGGWKGFFNLNGYAPASGEETCDCEVAEVVMYDRRLSDVERNQVEGYLRSKWLAASSTPSGSGVTSWAATPVALGRRAPLGTTSTTYVYALAAVGKEVAKSPATTSWSVATVGGTTTTVNEDFSDGAAGTSINPTGYVTGQTWMVGLQYDGAGNARTGTAQYDYQSNQHTTVLPADCWAEATFLKTTASAWLNFGVSIRMPAEAEIGSAGYSFYDSGTTYYLYRGGIAAGGARGPSPIQVGVPITYGIQMVGNVVKLFINGAEVYSYTDPAPLNQGPYTGITMGTFAQGDLLLQSHRAGALSTAGAIGKETPKSTVITTYTENLVVTGKRSPQGNRTISNVWACAAVGAKPVVGMKQGAGTTTYAYDRGATVGKRAPKGAAIATYAETLTGVGKEPAKGLAGAISWAAAPVSVGKRTPKASATVTALQTPAATGKRVPKAPGTTSWTYVQFAQGVKPVPGMKQGSALGYWVAALGSLTLGPQERMLADTLPATLSAGNYTLGGRFTPTVNGRITHIRYYHQGGYPDATHKVQLWDMVSGTELASTTHVDTPAFAGWHETALPTPVLVTAGVSYVASFMSAGYGYCYTYAPPPSQTPNLTHR